MNAEDYNPENKGVIEIIKTPFQANPEIARQMVCGNADCILSGDSDFQMYIGASASTDMMIWFPKIDYNSSSFKKAQLVTGQKGIMTWINNSLQLKGTNNYFPKDLPFPIFDDMKDPLCRAFLAVALRYDVFPRRLRDFGPAKALTIKKETDDLSTIQENQSYIMERILSFKTKTNINRESLLCYAHSILYELACNGYIYSNDIPNALDAYIANFKLSDASTTIMNGVGSDKED